MKTNIEIGVDSLEDCFDLVDELAKGAKHERFDLPDNLFKHDLLYPEGWRGGVDRYSISNPSENYEYTVTSPTRIEQKCSVEYESASFIINMIVALGSAGAFTAVYKIIRHWLARNKDRSVLLKTDRGEIKLSGQSAADQRELLEKLMPAILDD
jgi:hypothetical protein